MKVNKAIVPYLFTILFTILFIIIVFSLLFKPAGSFRKELLLKNTSMETEMYFSKDWKERSTIMIIAGMHGNELAGVEAAQKIVENPKLLSNNFNYVIIPMANKAAVKEKARVYAMKDLNRAFPGNVNGKKEEQLAFAISSVIGDFKPIVIVDLHESYGIWEKDFGAVPNTFIINDPEKYFDLVTFLEDSSKDFSSLSSPPEGSLNKEVSVLYNLPIITVETSQLELMDDRIDKHIKMIILIVSFFEEIND